MNKQTLAIISNPKNIIPFSICTVALGILYFDVFRSLVDDWINLPDFSHGFFIPLVSLYLVWDNVGKLNETEQAPANSGLSFILLGVFLLFIGNLASESFTMRFSFLVVISGIIIFLQGWPRFGILLFPVAYLFFMIPIPSVLMIKLTFPLQLFASKVATSSLQLCGIPVLREGNVIHLAETTLEVAEACSGIRSLISLLALGTIFAYLVQKTWWQKVLLIFCCIPVAIAVNALRVSATGILAHNYGIQVAEGFFHEFSGFLLFIVAFALLWLISYLISKISK